jgi:hypothetical protein
MRQKLDRARSAVHDRLFNFDLSAAIARERSLLIGALPWIGAMRVRCISAPHIKQYGDGAGERIGGAQSRALAERKNAPRPINPFLTDQPGKLSGDA